MQCQAGLVQGLYALSDELYPVFLTGGFEVE